MTATWPSSAYTFFPLPEASTSVGAQTPSSLDHTHVHLAPTHVLLVSSEQRQLLLLLLLLGPLRQLLATLALVEH